MPDASGKLSSTEKDSVIEWLNARSRSPIICPVCGEANWFIADHVVQPITLGAGGSVMLGGVGYPQVMLVSNKCGHTIFLSAVIGIVKPSPQLTWSPT
jgi:hypothetical protein